MVRHGGDTETRFRLLPGGGSTGRACCRQAPLGLPSPGASILGDSMGQFRKIEVRMWGDARFLALDNQGKLAWVYLLTGPHTTTLPGLWRMSRLEAADDLGMDPKRFQERFREWFAEPFREPMAEADWTAKVVWVPKAIVYNPCPNENVMKHWSDHFSAVPESPLKLKAWHTFADHFDDSSKEWVKGFAKLFAKPLPEPLPERYAKPEQSRAEQETEQNRQDIPKQVRDAFAIGLRLKDAAGGRSAAYKLTDQRRKKIASRLRELEKLKKAEGWQLDTLEVVEGVLERFYDSAWHRERGLTDFCKSVFHSWEKFERWLNDAYEPSKRGTESAGEPVGDDRPDHGKVFRDPTNGRILTGEEAEQAAAKQERYPSWDPRCGYGSGRADRASDEMDFG